MGLPVQSAPKEEKMLGKVGWVGKGEVELIMLLDFQNHYFRESNSKRKKKIHPMDEALVFINQEI